MTPSILPLQSWEPSISSPSSRDVSTEPQGSPLPLRQPEMIPFSTTREVGTVEEKDRRGGGGRGGGGAKHSQEQQLLTSLQQHRLWCSKVTAAVLSFRASHSLVSQTLRSPVSSVLYRLVWLTSYPMLQAFLFFLCIHYTVNVSSDYLGK